MTRATRARLLAAWVVLRVGAYGLALRLLVQAILGVRDASGVRT